MKKLFAAVVLALVALNVNAAGRVFYDGFESGTTTLWQQDNSREKCVVVSTATDGLFAAHNGGKFAQCTSRPNLAWNDPATFQTLYLPGTSTPHTQELFLRFWHRMDKNHFRSSASPKKFARFFNQPSGSGAYNEIYQFGQGMQGGNVVAFNAGVNQLATYWGGFPGDASNSDYAWHKQEYYFNYVTGQIKVWHDGLLVAPRQGNPGFDGARWENFYLTSNWGDQSNDPSINWSLYPKNDMYFDEFEVYSDTGTGATGLMSDATITTGTTTPPPAGCDCTALKATIAAQGIQIDNLTKANVAKDATISKLQTSNTALQAKIDKARPLSAAATSALQ